jgi:hypothetical protein
MYSTAARAALFQIEAGARQPPPRDVAHEGRDKPLEKDTGDRLCTARSNPHVCSSVAESKDPR